MLKTLKWIYKLGQNNERQRIHRIATIFIQDNAMHRRNLDIEFNRFGLMDEKEQNVSKESLNREKARVERDNEVARVLEALIFPGRSMEPGPAPLNDEKL